MEGYRSKREKGETVYVGIDLHLYQWHITARTKDQELFSGNIAGRWEALLKLLGRYRGHRIYVVYEAGYFGFMIDWSLAGFTVL